MKRVLLDENMDIVKNFPVASMYFAMAHRGGYVEGAPVALMRVTQSKEGQANGFIEGSIKAHPEQLTLGYNKILTRENYSGVKDVVFNPVTVELGEALLKFGYSLLERNEIIVGVNDT